ncbi:hypothetical protein IscW_ISCW000022 [Ixodes scapularis]|uniref:Protein PRRC2A n=1 Tax=Ixodes scapularis TaxID=6945 RepID=B7P1V6_IXOSC|nr:hypothetical protein IscW_ISCW000022 [Ixodes scapularis]|eukprot:XP_002433514.1 hypothetical protein IscW_ISCW000022 [Ixodes scapularis]
MPSGARPPYSYSDGRVRTMRNQPEDDAYQRPAIISEKDLEGFDEILQNDSQDGWAVAKGEIDYNAKLVFRDEEEPSGRPSLPGPPQGKAEERGSPKLPPSSKGDARGLPQGNKASQALRGREAAWDSAPTQQQQQRSREPPQSYLDRPHHGTFGGQPPPVGGRGGAPPGSRPLELAGDEEELWRQRRQQQNDEMAVTVERTRQRREEEEKRYEQIKQSSGAATAATTQQQQGEKGGASPVAPVAMGQQEKEELEERSRHSSESRDEPPRGGAPLPPLPSSRLDRMDFRQPQQQQQQQAPPAGGGYQAPSSLPPGGGGMVGVNFDPRWAAMGGPAAYLSQLGMGPQLKGAAVAEVAPYPPEAGERPYEARGEGAPRPPSMECWASSRPLGDRPPPPPQAAPLAPPHVPPGGPYDTWRPSVPPVYYEQVPEFGRGSGGYDQRLDFAAKRPEKEEIPFDNRSRGDSFRKEREFEEKQQRDKRESRDVMGAWTNSRDYDQRVGRDKWERESRPSRPDSRDSRTSRDSLRDERAMPPTEQQQRPEAPPAGPPPEPHRNVGGERPKEKPQVPDWSESPYPAAETGKRRDWHTHHPPPVTQQQLDSAGPGKKNFVPLRRGAPKEGPRGEEGPKEEGKGTEGAKAVGEDHQRPEESKEAAKKEESDKRGGTSRSRGSRFESGRGRGGQRGGGGAYGGGNGSGGSVGYRGRSREYRRSRTERGPRFDRKKEDGSEESSEEEKPPRPKEDEGSDEVGPDVGPDAARKPGGPRGGPAKETRGREPSRRDEAKKEEKSAFSPRGEPSRRGRGGMSFGRSSRGRYPVGGGYGPPTMKAPFGKPEEDGKEEESPKDGPSGSKPRSTSRPVVRRPNRMEPLPPRFQKHQAPRRQEGAKGGGRGAKEALSDVGNEDWETASESSDVADRRGPNEEGTRPPKKSGGAQPPAPSKPPGTGQERPARRPGGEPRRGGGGGGERNGRAPPVQRREPGLHQQPRLGGGGAGRGRQAGGGGGRARQQPPRSGDAGGSSPRGDPATLVYRVDEVKLQDPGNVQAALSDLGSRKHLKKTDPLQQNGRLEKEKPNALEGIDLSNYAGVVVIDDNPAVTDHSFGDGDDGDFQEVTSKKRHRLLADGDTKKLRKETARNKTVVHGRQNKLPPRLIKKRESDRLFSTKADVPPQKVDGGAAPGSDASVEVANGPKGQTHPAFTVKGTTLESFDRGSDQHDSGIDVSDQPPSAASSQRSSPSNDGKVLLPKPVAPQQTQGPPSQGASATASVGPPMTVGLDSGKPMGTVIFENKNFKAENAALDKFEIQTKTQVEPIAANGPVLTPVGSKDCKEPLESGKPKLQMAGEDTADMKLDFTFGPELAQFGEDKSAKHMAVPRSLSSEIGAVGSPMSPSTDELNLKIASVKKVWETVGPLSTVVEHGAASAEEVGPAPGTGTGAAFGTFGSGPQSSEGSFAASGGLQDGATQQGQQEGAAQGVGPPGEPAYSPASQLKQVASSSALSHHHSVPVQVLMRQAHQSHSMLDQSGGLHKVKSGMQHTLSPPPAGAPSSSSLAGVDVRAMNLQVAGMPQAVPSPPTAALLFSGAQQMPQPTAGLYQTLLPDPVSRPVAQFSQGAHGYPPMASYQGFSQGGVFDLFAAGAALRLQPTYQTQHVPTSQAWAQEMAVRDGPVT